MSFSRGGGSPPPLVIGCAAGGFRRAGFSTGKFGTRQPGLPSTAAVQRYLEGDTAGSSRKNTILDAFHLGDLVDEPHAGDGEHDAECQGERIDDHSMAIVLLVPRALIFFRICHGGRVEFRQRFLAGRAVLQWPRGTRPKRDYAPRFRLLPLLRVHLRLYHALGSALPADCGEIITAEARTATPWYAHGRNFRQELRSAARSTGMACHQARIGWRSRVGSGMMARGPARRAIFAGIGERARGGPHG